MRSRRKCQEFLLFWGKVFGGLFLIATPHKGTGMAGSCQQVVTRGKITRNRTETMYFNHFCVRPYYSLSCLFIFLYIPSKTTYIFKCFLMLLPWLPVGAFSLQCSIIVQIFSPAADLLNLIPNNPAHRPPWLRPPCLCWGLLGSWTAAPRARWEAAATASLVGTRPYWPA